MKQHLRSFLTLLMLVVWASGFAQDTETIDLTKQGFENATVVSEVTGTDVKLSFAKGTNTNVPTYYTADKTVRLYVNNTLTISSTTKEIAQIVFTLAPDKKAIEPDTKSFSTGSYSASTHTWTGKTNKIILTQKTNGKQFRIQKLVITFVKEGPSKTATTLTFPNPTINIEEGNEATFTGQTATLKTGGTELNNAITYTTNNDAMFEEYDAKVGPTKLKTSAYGTATVTAKFNGDDTYEASTATYTVNYTEKEKPATTLDFGFTTKTANITETFTATAALKKADGTAISDAVKYTSSKPEVATVDETTGKVSALTAGKTTITATFAGTREYKSSTASYELIVVDPNAPLDNIVFDAVTKGFNNMFRSNSYPSGTKNADFKTIDGKTYTFSYSNCMRNTNKDYNPDVIQMRNKKNSMGTITSPVFDKMPNGYKVNVYYGISEGNKPLTITSNEETSAESISNTYGDKDIKKGKGYCTSIILTNGSSFTVNVGGSACYVSKIEIIPLSTPITLDENAVNTDTKIAKNNGKTLDVTLTRTLVAKKWNTFCVPFETEIAGTALEGATVKTIGTVVGNVINLVDATKIEAGVPYLVMPNTESIVNPTFKSVTISVTTPIVKGNDDYKFVGTYSPKTIFDKDFGKIWGVTADGKLAKINANTTMKGLRAYFVFPTNTAAAKLNFDGETTGINNIETNATVNGKVYNLNGQYVGNSLNGLKKGIYVVNGKKVIK